MSTAVTAMDQRHPMQKHLDLVFDDLRRGDDESLDVSYMSKSFCLSGLPLRKQFERDRVTRKAVEPSRESTFFSRKDDQVALSISGTQFDLPVRDDDDRETLLVQTGLPYGARARLLILWMTSQARLNPSSRWLEIGKIEPWLEEVGITPHPEAAAAVKDQLIRLTFALFTMVLKNENMDFFNQDKLIASSVFPNDDIRHYARGELAKVRFPLGIELSSVAHQRFTKADVIPVSTEALRKISNNAMAIDIFLYLSYKLPLIGRDDSYMLTWKKLIKQFGNGETQSKFRQVFDSSIARALDAYRGANVEVTEEGLKLKYSDPTEAGKMFVVSRPKAIGNSTRVRNRIAPPPSRSVDGKQLGMEL